MWICYCCSKCLLRTEIFFESRDDLFDKQRDQSKFADVYKNYVKDCLSSCMDALPAALIIEPGMHFDLESIGLSKLGSFNIFWQGLLT
mgnify:CR=1 FL=1